MTNEQNFTPHVNFWIDNILNPPSWKSTILDLMIFIGNFMISLFYRKTSKSSNNKKPAHTHMYFLIRQVWIWQPQGWCRPAIKVNNPNILQITKILKIEKIWVFRINQTSLYFKLYMVERLACIFKFSCK